MMYNGLMLAKVHFSHDKSSLHKDFSASLPPCVVSLPRCLPQTGKGFPSNSSPLWHKHRYRSPHPLMPNRSETRHNDYCFWFPSRSLYPWICHFPVFIETGREFKDTLYIIYKYTFLRYIPHPHVISLMFSECWTQHITVCSAWKIWLGI